MRLRWTHDAVVYGERRVGRNEIGTEQTITDAPVIEFPCRLQSSREEIDLDETGSRIEREPYAVVPIYGHDPDDRDAILTTVEVVEEGMDMGLTDRWLTSTEERLQVLSIDMDRGRGNAPSAVILGLERLSGDAGSA